MYIVIQDKSPNHEFAEYTNSTGNFYIIHETTAANPTVGGGAILTDDISAYTLLPSIVAQQAASLQTTKTNAIKKLTNTLETTLSAGVVVSNDSLKTSEWKVTKRGGGIGKIGTSNSVVLNAGATDLVAFTQAATMVATAAATASDPVAFGNLSVSSLFSRPITDASGNAIDLTVNQFRQLVLTLGSVVGGLQATLVSKVSQITAATTAAEVQAIVTGS